MQWLVTAALYYPGRPTHPRPTSSSTYTVLHLCGYTIAFLSFINPTEVFDLINNSSAAQPTQHQYILSLMVKHKIKHYDTKKIQLGYELRQTIAIPCPWVTILVSIFSYCIVSVENHMPCQPLRVVGYHSMPSDDNATPSLAISPPT